MEEANKTSSSGSGSNNLQGGQKKLIAMHHREFFDKIRTHLPPELTEEILVLRSHLITEYYLNSLLALTLPVREGYRFSSDRVRFSDKIKKVLELELLQPNEIEAISRLNKLRNKFAHDINYKVSEADLDFIGFCFGKSYMTDKYSPKDDGGDKDLKYRLRILLLDVVIAPAAKFWTNIKVATETR